MSKTISKDFDAAAARSLPVTRSVTKDGTAEFHDEFRRLHRVDGPARELSNGNKAWYQFGQMHRADGPAFTQPNGLKLWFLGGELHRDEGPAIECPNGYTEWRHHGRKLEAHEIEAILALQKKRAEAEECRREAERAALSLREGTEREVPVNRPLRFNKRL
jgi:hypothetical protein